jgi:very-short-patch-repair endonuclease
MGNRKIENNVIAFLDKASTLYSNMKAEGFSQWMYTAMIEDGIQSPIEDLFFIAFNAMAESSFSEVNPPYLFNNIDATTSCGRGVYIKPQYKINKYKVDFMIHSHGIAPEEYCTPVVIELDGHDFHDKNKQQRAYEKSRDRHIVKSGFRILHYTGSEIFADPFKAAYEVLCMIGAFGSSPLEYRPEDPLGGY